MNTCLILLISHLYIDIYRCDFYMSDISGAVMGFKDDVRRAKALTDESRLAILLALQNGERCGCSLMELLKILSQPFRII